MVQCIAPKYTLESGEQIDSNTLRIFLVQMFKNTPATSIVSATQESQSKVIDEYKK